MKVLNKNLPPERVLYALKNLLSVKQF